MFRILSWNVNGIRAAFKKGFADWLAKVSPEILCIQETKARPDQLSDEILAPEGYHAYWASAEKKGYSGVAVYTKQEPISTRFSGIDRFDDEGRVLQLFFDQFVVISAYFPNSQDAGKRLDYKLDFCDSIHTICRDHTDAGRKIILCGDYNIAHKPIDLARPKENEGSAGYLPEERAWMETFTSDGYVDTFRKFNQEGGNYTWWSYQTRGRERNVGWRIDYHCANPAMDQHVSAASILSDVMGSDHCPIAVTIDGLDI
jgi:exodeoxyribonuclease III